MQRKRRGWPTLKRLDIRRLTRRPETPDVVRKLLEPKQVDVNEDISSCSDISDVFAEFHQDSFFNARKKGRKPISKYDADVLTMNRFTEDFKDTMAKTKNELQIEKNMINEDLESIEKVIKTPRRRRDLPETLKEEIRKLLEETENITLDVSQEKDSKKSDDQGLSYDYMSGIWCMLDAHCQNTKFTVSPMNFDVFNQSPKHWLQRPDISQQAIEDSKLKCQVWLNKHYV